MSFAGEASELLLPHVSFAGEASELLLPCVSFAGEASELLLPCVSFAGEASELLLSCVSFAGEATHASELSPCFQTLCCLVWWPSSRSSLSTCRPSCTVPARRKWHCGHTSSPRWETPRICLRLEPGLRFGLFCDFMLVE